MANFLVGEDGVRLPYWATSPNEFGGQINASSNGDMPGDIYRFVGGVVVRAPDSPPAYAGYLASGFILRGKTNNNRVVAAGSEDLTGPDGSTARFWLAGTRPGTIYSVGRSFAPAIQVDPILPAAITFTLRCPDGRVLVAQGVPDRSGVFVGAERWSLDEPGLYRYTIDAEWQGHKGRMPGLPPDGGHLYVVERDTFTGRSGLDLDLGDESTFDMQGRLSIAGRSTARSVWFAAVIPGAVIDEGELPVQNGKFEYLFDPASISKRFPTYDTFSLTGFTPELKRVVHMTFFSREVSPDGRPYHAFARLIMRGNKVLYTR
jgi:hypothetical protein